MGSRVLVRSGAVLVGFLWVRVNSGGFWCSYGAVMVRSGGVLVGSGSAP